MRLDHLLSKEQLAGAGSPDILVGGGLSGSDVIFTALCVVGGAHWWTLTFRILDRLPRVSTAPPGCRLLLGVGGVDWVGTCVVGVRGFVGTLLGPETTSSVSLCRRPVWGGGVGGVGVGVFRPGRACRYTGLINVSGVGAGGCVWSGFVV